MTAVRSREELERNGGSQQSPRAAPDVMKMEQRACPGGRSVPAQPPAGETNHSTILSFSFLSARGVNWPLVGFTFL